MKAANQAIFDMTGTIFGVGKNIKEAIIEANDSLESENKIEKAADLGTINDFRNRSLGKRLFVCDCTPEFMALVKRNLNSIAPGLGGGLS